MGLRSLRCMIGLGLGILAACGDVGAGVATSESPAPWHLHVTVGDVGAWVTADAVGHADTPLVPEAVIAPVSVSVLSA